MAQKLAQNRKKVQYLHICLILRLLSTASSLSLLGSLSLSVSVCVYHCPFFPPQGSVILMNCWHFPEFCNQLCFVGVMFIVFFLPWVFSLTIFFILYQTFSCLHNCNTLEFSNSLVAGNACHFSDTVKSYWVCSCIQCAFSFWSWFCIYNNPIYNCI